MKMPAWLGRTADATLRAIDADHDADSLDAANDQVLDLLAQNDRLLQQIATANAARETDARHRATLQGALNEMRDQLDARDAGQELLAGIVVRVARLADEIQRVVAVEDAARGDQHGRDRPQHARALTEVERRIRAALDHRSVEPLAGVPA